MKKIVSTEMRDDAVVIQISVSSDGASSVVPDTLSVEFPMRFVNPRISLQIASLLSSDPTVNVPSPDYEETSN